MSYNVERDSSHSTKAIHQNGLRVDFITNVPCTGFTNVLRSDLLAKIKDQSKSLQV